VNATLGDNHTVMKHVLAILVVVAANASAQSPPAGLWQELQAKRAALTAYHQEFEVNQIAVLPDGTRNNKRVEVVDVAGRQWREVRGRGTAARIRLFDGQGQFDVGDTEFIRVRRNAKDLDPVPSAYDFDRLDLSKLVELERRPCGFDVDDHPCVVFEMGVKPWVDQISSGVVRAQAGIGRLMFDTQTGLLVHRSTAQMVSQPGATYRRDVTYRLTRMRRGDVPTAALFSLPRDAREVKKFTSWDAKRMRNQLAGKPAPELNLTTLDGKPVSLEALKGKIVVLDFWATWCPPCRVDGPALDKLHAKFGNQLAIIGLSMGEDRGVVEKFLKQYPHRFPIALSAENELPRHYDVAVLPTYVIIDAHGNVDTAIEGDRGLSSVRSRLKQAGLDVD
jgi:thiol-disulfide isomerase/thioredoxin